MCYVRTGVEERFPALYAELRALAGRHFRGGLAGHTLQPTALVNEVFVKLAGSSVAANDDSHFFAVAATAMRQILVDHARKRVALRRGGGALRVTLVDELARPASSHGELDVLALEDVLAKYEELDPRGAEIIELRFFGGMTESEVAEHLGLSRRTVAREWRLAKAWLAEALDE